MESPNPFVAALREWTGVFMRHSMRHLLLYSKRSGLSMSQIGALQLIHHRGVCGVSDMGSNLGISSAAASQMLERLVHQGLVVRSEDPHDRRLKQIVMTKKGHQVLQESALAHMGWLDALAVLLTPKEQGQVTSALRILLERANHFENDDKQDCDG
jgi:DNA-binding MarR family transcriptional regulator